MSKGVGKSLTADLVVSKTKSDSLHNIKNLNLWGNDLEDLKLLRQMGNLEVVSLSVNRISSLKEFSYCPKLQELYLRKNNIADLRQIKHLIKLPQLKVLWLHDNPCALTENYRDIVIKFLPNLQKLDNNPVTQQQRQNCQKISFNLDDYDDQNEPRQSRAGTKSQFQQKKSEYIQKKQQYQQRVPVERSTNYEQKFSNISQNQKKNQIEYFQPKVQVTQQKQINNSTYQVMERNKNILMAVISLVKQLDQNSLQISRMEIQKLLALKRK